MRLPAYVNFLFLSTLCIGGCGIQPSAVSSAAAGVEPIGISGKVMGGQQPISGASIQLYTAGTGGDGSAAKALLSTPAISGLDGSFSIVTPYTCSPSTALVYLLATGGNPGIAGTNNSAIAVLAVLGQCQTVNASTMVDANEVTTVAAVAALQSFMTSATQIGSSASDASSLASAFALAAQLATTGTGSTPGTGVPAGYSVPTQQIQTLADIVATCINSRGGKAGDGSNCGNLFTDATPASGTPPTDTVLALLDIFSNPSTSIASLFSLASTSGPFQPSLSAPPPNWSVSLYTTNPALQVSVASLTFPSMAIAFPSSSRTVTLTNSGSSTITLNSLTSTGANGTDFNITSNTCTQKLVSGTWNGTWTIPAGGNCALTVDFVPTGLAARYGDLALVNSASTTLYVPLSGTGTPDSITVNFTTSAPLAVPTRSNFSGANMDPFSSGTSYLDQTMQGLTQSMSIGWLRFPAGTEDDPYQWNYAGTAPNYIGQTPSTWVNAFSSYNPYNIMVNDLPIIAGKGGVNLPDFATFLKTQSTGTAGASGVSPTQAIGVINIFTDSVASAGSLVTAAGAAGISTTVWELGNETSYFPTFYSTSTNATQQAMDYLAYVKPYAKQIKMANSMATVAVWVPPNGDAWTQGVAAYAQTNGAFWDQLYTHTYPGANASGYTVLSDQIAFYNGFLANNTNTLIDKTIAPLFGSKMKPLEISEFNINPLQGTLYDGVYITEYTMRLATDPLVTNVGMHVLFAAENSFETAISPTNDHINDCTNAYKSGTVVDTSNLNFGYFLTPEGLAMQIMNKDINTSAGIWPTAVTNSPPTTTITAGNYGTIDSIYAQAYQYAGTTKHILLTNKIGIPLTVTITQNSASLPGPFTTTSIGGTDPTLMNTSSAKTAVQTVVTTNVSGPTFTLPAYSVMDVSWIQ